MLEIDNEDSGAETEGSASSVPESARKTENIVSGWKKIIGHPENVERPSVLSGGLGRKDDSFKMSENAVTAEGDEGLEGMKVGDALAGDGRLSFVCDEEFLEWKSQTRSQLVSKERACGVRRRIRRMMSSDRRSWSGIRHLRIE